MPPYVASTAFAVGVVGLFILDRDPANRTSKALWIPVIWLWIAASRAVSEWMAAMGWSAPIANAADTYADGSPLDRNILTVLLVLGLVVLVRRKRFGPLLRSNGPILLFFLYAALSTLWSDYPAVTIRRWFKDLGDLVMVMVILTDRDWHTAIRQALVRTGFLLVPHSVLLIKYYPAIGRTINRWTWMASYTGVTTHKNLLGRVSLIFGIAFVSCFLSAYRDRNRPNRTRHLLAHGVALSMVLWIFMVADSVTSLSCFLLATAFLLATDRPTFAGPRWTLHVLVATLMVVPFATTFLGVGGVALEGMGRDSTLTGRTVIWDLVLAEAGNPLVGIGFESFWLGDRLEKIQSAHQGLNESHNGYLEIFLTLGWIGVVLLAVVIIVGYRNIIRSIRQNPEVGRLRMAYLVAALVLSFTEAGFRMLTTSWMTFLMATMAIPEARNHVGVLSDWMNAKPFRPSDLKSRLVALSRVAQNSLPATSVLRGALPDDRPKSV